MRDLSTMIRAMNGATRIKPFEMANFADLGDAPVNPADIQDCMHRITKFYKKIKANNITPEHDTYNNFIHEVSQRLGRITLKEDSYKCENCQMNYEK